MADTAPNINVPPASKDIDLFSVESEAPEKAKSLGSDRQVECPEKEGHSMASAPYILQKHPDPIAVLDNGSEFTPLLTLKNDHGGVAHIMEDDHCYVLTISAGRKDGRVQMTPWWFGEAFEAARSLPALVGP